MITSIAAALASALIAAAPAAQAPPVPHGIPGHWHLTLNQTPWQMAAGWNPYPWGDGPNNPDELGCLTPGNVTAGRYLDLALREHTCWSPRLGKYLPYTAGWLSTGSQSAPSPHRAWAQEYGAFEARIWLPGADRGIANWPAFWLVGKYWPEDGEIDIMEGLRGRDCQTYHHGPAGTPPDQTGTPATPNCTSAKPGWNTYGVRWSPNRIAWYLNGHLSGVLDIRTAADPMQIIVDYTTSAKSPVLVPAVMRVAYVRAWKETPGA